MIGPPWRFPTLSAALDEHRHERPADRRPMRMPTPEHRPTPHHAANLPFPERPHPHRITTTAPLHHRKHHTATPPPPIADALHVGPKPDFFAFTFSYTSGRPRPKILNSSSPSRPTANHRTPTPYARPRTRYGQPHDLPAIDAIRRTYSNQLGFLTATAIATAIATNRVLVAHANGQLVGYAIFRRSARGLPNTATIYHLAVARHLRRRGYGQLLHRRLVAELATAGCTAIQAWTRNDIDGHRFFPRLNYIPILSKLPLNARRRPITLWRRLLHPNGHPTLLSPPLFSGGIHRSHQR